MMKSAFSAVGLAHKLCLAAEAQGYSPQLLNDLAEHPTLFRDLLRLQYGQVFLTDVPHVINCDDEPYMPEGWGKLTHHKGGHWKFDSKQVELFLAHGQSGINYTGVESLNREMVKKGIENLLNANVLDYLLAFPHLIPEDWKGMHVFFWGTIYRHRNGYPCVRCLYCGQDNKWYEGQNLLDGRWYGYQPAAIRVS